jgi:hypothetical protein
MTNALIEDYEELIDSKLAASPVLEKRIGEARANYEAGEGGSYEVLRQELLNKDVKSFIAKIWRSTSSESDSDERG